MTKTITISDETYAALQADIEKLESKSKGGRLWLPKRGEEYWYANADKGDVGPWGWGNDSTDRCGLALGNVFKTEEEAIKHSKYIQALYEIKKYIAENFPAWEPDWSNETPKWNVMFDHHRNDLRCDSWHIINHPLLFPYLESEEQCEQLIESQKSNLEIVFGVKG